MARQRKQDPDAEAAVPATAVAPLPPSPTEGGMAGNGSPRDAPAQPVSEEKRPAYKVGPILTDKSNAVECAVWESAMTLADGSRFPVHTVTVQASCRDGEGKWKPTKGFRGSQLYAVLYCLQRASDFILAQRDAANDCPF